MKKLFILLLCLVPFCSGCAIGILAAGIGAASMMDKQGKAKIIASQTERDKLRLEYEQLNLERQKCGYEPLPIPETLTEKPPMLSKELKEQTTNETSNRNTKTNFNKKAR